MWTLFILKLSQYNSTTEMG